MTPNVGKFLKQLDTILAGENAKVYGLLGKQFGSPLQVSMYFQYDPAIPLLGIY